MEYRWRNINQAQDRKPLSFSFNIWTSRQQTYQTVCALEQGQQPELLAFLEYAGSPDSKPMIRHNNDRRVIINKL